MKDYFYWTNLYKEISTKHILELFVQYLLKALNFFHEVIHTVMHKNNKYIL